MQRESRTVAPASCRLSWRRPAATLRGRKNPVTNGIYGDDQDYRGLGAARNAAGSPPGARRYSLGAVMVSDGPLNVTEQGLVVVSFFNFTKPEFIAGRRAPVQRKILAELIVSSHRIETKG